MTLAELLTSQRRWGRTRARKFLLPLALNENKQPRHPDPAPARAARDRARRVAAPADATRSSSRREAAQPPLRPTDPEAEAAGGALECAAQEEEGDGEGDGADGEADGEDQAGEVEEAADGEDEDGAGEQGGVGAVAGEVLAERDLHAAEPGEDDADADRGRAGRRRAPITEHTIPARTSARQRERAPGRRAGARRLAGFPASRSTAASRPANGHPEETLTRHQPISIPSGPRRGRECQSPQPGSPTSAREIRSHL